PEYSPWAPIVARTRRSEIPLSRLFENRAQDRQRVAADVDEGVDAGVVQVRLPFGGLAGEKERAGARGLECLGGIRGLARIDRVRAAQAGEAEPRSLEGRDHHGTAPGPARQ